MGIRISIQVNRSGVVPIYTKREVIHICTIGMTAEKLLLPQAKYLRDHGYNVSFMFSPDEDCRRKLIGEGFEVYECPISRRICADDFSGVIRAARILRKLQPDIVHTHTSKAGIIGRLAARIAGVSNVLHTIHGFPFTEGQGFLKYNAYVAIERWAGRFTDVLLSQSREDVVNAERLGIRSRNGYPILISNGVDIDRFCLQKNTGFRSYIRDELNIGDEPVISIIARQNYEKGYFELIEALENLKQIDWTAIFIGADEGAGDEIKDLLNNKSLTSRVRILGHREDIEHLLATSDIYVLPSYREGVPRSLIEAQAMGLPVIATDIRGCREVVKNGVNGLLIPTRNTQALEYALQVLLENPWLRRTMGDEGRLMVEKEFDECRVFERIGQVYENLFRNI